MGFVVLHINKASGNDAGMTAHIERTIDPANADPARKNLNQDLIPYPDGIKDRTQAIQHRLDNAGLTRKIGTNQVRALRVMLSGTPEDMQRIKASGKLGQWSDDNLDWLRKTYGADNVVSAVLHMDEKTPHIHATVAPIVTGERRKAQAKPAEPGKKQYRKKKSDAPRLCADDVMARDKLKGYQDTYAEAMTKYGLQRGIDGSEARHITNIEYYRNIVANNQAIVNETEQLIESKEARRQEVMELEQATQQAQSRTGNALAKAEQAEAGQKQAESRLADTREELSREKRKLAGQKFKNTAAEAGTKIADGLGSLLGSPKIERQQKEIADLKADNEALKERLDNKDVQISNHQAGIERLNKAHEKDIAVKQRELDRIAFWFPDIPQMTRTADYCREIGFSHEQTKDLLRLNPVQYTGKLRSPKSDRSYDADNVTARFERLSGTSGFTLTINGTPILLWFKQKFDELQQKLGIKPTQPPTQSRGRGM